MFLPDDILERLTCSTCEQYLSVKPIKVYPNRQVKCGRCSEDNDGGVVSPHYDTVIRDLRFPCINRYEGCRARLRCSEMDAHEELCPIQVGCYTCPLCASFDGTAFMILVHFKNEHSKNILKNKTDFTVDLEKNQELIYLYVTKNSLQDLLALVYFKYDELLKQITLSIQLFIGENLNIPLHSSFTFSCVEGNLKFKSSKTRCLPFRNHLNNGEITVPIDAGKYPKNILQCTFFIEDIPSQIYEKSRTCEPLSGSVKLRHTFNEIQNLETRSYSPCFDVCGAIWCFFVGRDVDHTDKEFLGLFLELKEYSRESFCLKVAANFQLVSTKFKKTKLQEGNFLFKSLGDAFGYREFISFDRLLEHKNGYLHDDSVTIELDMTVAPYVEEKLYCKCDCKCCKKVVVCAGKESIPDEEVSIIN